MTSVHSALDTRIFYRECVSLAKKYEVHLIAPHEREEVKEGVHISPLRKPGYRLSRFILTDTSLLRKALKLKAYVYHFHDPELIPVGLILRMLGKKVIYDIHEDVPADLKEKEWLPFKKAASACYSFFESLAIRKMCLVLANEAYIATYGKKTNRYTLVQNFVRADTLMPYRRTEYKPSDKLLLVGNLSGRRGLEPCLRSLYLLKRQGIIIQLQCVGRKDAEVDKILNDFPHWDEIRDQLHFSGFIPFEKAYRDAAGCLAGIALLENIPNNRNNYPTKIFEYMAVGLPVIASGFPVTKELLEKHDIGYAVDPDSPEELAEAMKELFLNQEDSFAKGQNGLSLIEKGEYNWASEEARLFELYNKLCIS